MTKITAYKSFRWCPENVMWMSYIMTILSFIKYVIFETSETYKFHHYTKTEVFHYESLSKCDQIRSLIIFGYIYWRNP